MRVKYKNVHFFMILVVFTKSLAEKCIPLLKFQIKPFYYEYEIVVERINSINGEITKYEYIKPNTSGLCTIDYDDDLNEKVLRIGLLEELYPFIIHLKKEGMVTGLFGDTWNVLEKTLNFKSIYEKVNSFKDLESGRLHLVLRPFSVDIPSAYHVSSEVIYKNSYALFTISSGLSVPKWWYLHIFDNYIWFLLLLFIAILTIVIIIISYFAKFWHKPNEHYIDEFGHPSFSLLCVLGATSGQGFQDMPSSWSLRFCALSTLQMGMLLSCSFNSTLTSYLALRSHEVKVNSLNDVWKYQTHSLCVRHDSYAWLQIDNIINKGDTTLEFKNMQRRLLNRRCPDMRNDLEVKKNLCRDGFIYVDSYNRFLKAYKDVQQECELVKIQGNYWPFQYVFLHYKGSKYRKIIDKYLIRLQSSGVMKYLENKWIDNPQNSNKSQNIYQPVELGHVKILLGGLLLILIISPIICVLEVFWFKFIRKKRNYFFSTVK